jgi:mannose-6-phosphate isomerase-like protein (cupin superfamily)
MISVEEGGGGLTLKDSPTVPLSTGDCLLIKPGEPYYFSVTGSLTIRYIATPVWTPGQARIVE